MKDLVVSKSRSRFAARVAAVGPRVCAWVVLGIAATAGPASARSLDTLLEPYAGRPARGVAVAASPYLELFRRTISRGADFIATSTTPGFTYRLNPELGMFERSSGTLGPAFLERADTIGKGYGDVAVSALWASFKSFDGDSLDGLEEQAILAFGGLVQPEKIKFEELDVDAYAFYFSGTYGVTDDVDVNVLVPVFYTTVDVHQEFPGITDLPSFDGSDEALGIGDVQLRGKYRFYTGDVMRAAGGLSVRIPSGDRHDFQGSGDTTLTPSFVISTAGSRVDLHLALGLEVDVNRLEASRATYGTGASVAVFDWLTANVDLLGTSQITEDETDTTVFNVVPSEVRDGFGGQLPSYLAIESTPGGTRLITTLPRQDNLNVAAGVKAAISESAVVFASIIIPVLDQGVQADLIPAIGFQIGF